jgi:Glycosyl hydrolases family 16
MMCFCRLWIANLRSGAFFIGVLFELGSGFISTDSYQHGFFSASIKLPRGYTAGVVVAFYVSFSD